MLEKMQIPYVEGEFELGLSFPSCILGLPLLLGCVQSCLFPGSPSPTLITRENPHNCSPLEKAL